MLWLATPNQYYCVAQMPWAILVGYIHANRLSRSMQSGSHSNPEAHTNCSRCDKIHSLEWRSFVVSSSCAVAVPLISNCCRPNSTRGGINCTQSLGCAARTCWAGWKGKTDQEREIRGGRVRVAEDERRAVTIVLFPLQSYRPCNAPCVAWPSLLSCRPCSARA